MVQVSARLLDWLGAGITRQSIEKYLDDIEDLRCGVAALKDPADPVLHWAEGRNALLAGDLSG